MRISFYATQNRESCATVYTVVLLSQFVQPPSETEYKKITAGYLENWNFPNCLGSVDGKHCIIRAPLRDLVVFITTIKKHLV